MVASSRPAPLLQRLRAPLLLLCFFVSGATSLALETAWSKQLSYLLGNDLHGAATTVVSYMAGLGLGAWLATRLYRRIRSPLEAYAQLQGLIGILGMLSMPVLRSMHPVFDALHGLSDSPSVFLSLRFLVTFALLLPATTLMGMTLPIVIGAYDRPDRVVGTTAGVLYGANTLGAVTGTLIAGLALVPELGLSSTCSWVGRVDVGVGIVVLLLARGLARATSHSAAAVESSEAAPKPKETRAALRPALGIRLSYGTFGAVALGLELCWFRLLGPVIGPTAHAVSVTLAVFLLGIALGSLAASPFASRVSAPQKVYPLLILATASLALLPLFYLEKLPGWYQSLWLSADEAGTPADLIVTQTLEACTLMLPATLAMGAAFPFAVAAVAQKTKHRVASAVVAADLFYVNTLGAVLGTLAWGFFFIPQLGVHDAVRSAAAISVVAGVAVVVNHLRRAKSPGRPFARVAAAATLVAMFLWAFAPQTDPRILHIGVHASIRSERSEHDIERRISKTAEIVFAKDGLNGTVAVVKNRYGSGELDLVFSGKWVATTHRASRGHLHYLAHVPMLLAPELPRRAIVIGMGSGITSGALMRYPQLEHVDLVELEPVVIEASKFFEEFNQDPLGDPRATLTLQDGRTFLDYADGKYDLITSDPIHPWVKGAANLYTVQYYEIAAAHLSPGGIFAQWIPTSMSKPSFDSIVRSVKRGFSHVSLFLSQFEVIVLASHQPIEAHLDTFTRRARSDAVKNDLKSIGTSPEQLYRHVKKGLNPIGNIKRGQVNTDDNVFLEHRLPWDYFYDENFLLEQRRKKRERRKKGS